MNLPFILAIVAAAFYQFPQVKSFNLIPKWYEATTEAIQALQGNKLVEVTVLPIPEYWIEFKPKKVDPTQGFILYAGALVDYRAYSVLATIIAEAGILVIVPEMPMSLAIWGINRAHDVIAAFPEIADWTIGGHSLGGAMAARYAHQNQDVVTKLVLYSAFTTLDKNFKNTNTRVLSLIGSNDKVTGKTAQGSRKYLSENNLWIEITGGNHAYFGYYGEQDGDGVANVTREAQHKLSAESTIRFIVGNAARDSAKSNHVVEILLGSSAALAFVTGFAAVVLVKRQQKPEEDHNNFLSYSPSFKALKVLANCNGDNFAHNSNNKSMNYTHNNHKHF